MTSRRKLLIAGAGAVGLGALGVAGVELAPYRVKARLGLTPDPYVPDAAEGRVRLETVRSAALGGDTELFTAVPAGHGDGAGLPVVVVLHGATASVGDFQGLGFGRFLTAAVERGAPPFVLAGTDDGPNGWVPEGGGIDPQAMVLDEIPGWLSDRGFDADRRALWGWSRGGYGILRLAEVAPDWARAAALFSPAVVDGDQVFNGLAALAPLPLGVWCGTGDPFLDAIRDLVADLPVAPEVLTYAEGGHSQVFWNDHILEAFDWLAPQL
ncbi:MAG: alpha/beta hydrolase [Nocardioidaceae bacterium]